VGATPFWRAAFAQDVPALRLLVASGADPNLPTRRPDGPARAPGAADPSGLPPVPPGGPGLYAIHAASGAGFLGIGVCCHRHAPDGWLPAVRYLVEELGAGVNTRDHLGYSPLHYAAARGDNEVIRYLLSKGADPTVLSRRGESTASLARGGQRGGFGRVAFPETVKLLESVGSK
jgi:hypothetical protein